MDELLKALREGTVKSGDTRQIDLVNELGRQIKTLQQQADTMPVRVLEESCEAMLPYGCSIHIQEMQVHIYRESPLVPKKRPEAPLLGEYLFFHLRWKKEKGGKPVKKQTMSRKRNALYRETKAGMEALGTYKSEFEAPIKRYVELRLQYDILNEKWYENDCQITEVYTNKAGAKNQRKTALYLALETMRRELTEMENVLGLTPKGLKLLKTKGLEKKKGGALAEALRKADGEV